MEFINSIYYTIIKIINGISDMKSTNHIYSHVSEISVHHLLNELNEK